MRKTFPGDLLEHFLQTQGTMTYVTQDIGFVPVWLPLIYFNSVMTVGMFSRRLLLTNSVKWLN